MADPDAHVIYQMVGPTPADEDRLAMAALGARDIGFDVSLSTGNVDGAWVAQLRSSVSDEKARRLVAALVVGASRAVDDQWRATPADGRPTYRQAMREMVGPMIHSIQEGPASEAFKEYVESPRWEMDGEQLVDALFHADPELDEVLIGGFLTGSSLAEIARTVEPELTLSIEATRKWHKRPVREILAERPDLDYRQLYDSAFLATEEGERLRAAYAQFCAGVRFDHYKSWRINNKPLVPLSRYPVVAGFLEDVIRTSADPGRWLETSRLIRTVLISDSASTQWAVFETISSRAPKGPGHWPESPKEFWIKEKFVEEVFKAFRVADDGLDRRTVLRRGLQDVLNTFTSGEIARGVIAEDARLSEVLERPVSSGVREAKTIVGKLIGFFIASEDAELRGVAKHRIAEFCALPDGAIPGDKEHQGVFLNRRELQLVILDALGNPGIDSDAAVLAAAGSLVFDDPRIGKQIEQIVSMRMRALEVKGASEAIEASRELMSVRRTHPSNSLAEAAALEAYEQVVAPSRMLSRAAEKIQNQVTLDRLVEMASTGSLADVADVDHAKELVKRVTLGHKPNGEACKWLITVGTAPHASDEFKSAIASHLWDSYQHVSEDAAPGLGPVVAETLKMLLGPAGQIVPITRNIESGLGAVALLVTKHGDATFAALDPEAQAQISAYKKAVVQQSAHPSKIATGQLSSEEAAARPVTLGRAVGHMAQITQALSGPSKGSVAL